MSSIISPTTYSIQAPDGNTYTVDGPAGATQEQVQSEVTRQKPHLAGAAPPQSAPATHTSQALGFLQGITKPFDNAAQYLETGLNKLGVPTDRIDKALGTGSAADVAQAHQNYFDQKTASGTVPGATGRFAGEVVGTLPAAVLGPIAGGAASGALLSDAKTPGGMAADMGIGAVGGKIGDTVIRGVQRAVAPVVSPYVRQLLDAGTKLTPGQMIGGTAKRLEDAATSIPFVGDMINSAKRASVDSYNRGVVNRTLSPIGQSLPDSTATGHDAVGYAADKISDAYNQLLPQLALKPDQQLASEITQAGSAAGQLPKQEADQFGATLKREVFSRFKPDANGNPVMSGSDMKDAESALTQLATRLGSATDAYQRQLGDQIGAVRQSLRDALERSNPGAAPQLRSINQAYANLTRVENAASKASPTPSGADTGGIFTPGQLTTAVRQGDKSVRKRATARGDALLQDLADAGRAVLPSSVPDSGTAGRLITNGAILGGGAKLAGVLTPSVAGTAAGVAGLYSKPGQAAARFALGRVPTPTEQYVSNLLSKARAPAQITGAAAAVNSIAQRP